MRLLTDMDSIAHRVKRVATGWESQFTVVFDTIIDQSVVMDLSQAFYAANPPTRLRLRHETLSGTLYSLTSGQADLAIGVPMTSTTTPGLRFTEMGSVVGFVFAVAPQHPLASFPQPLSDEVLQAHRAVAVADSIPQGNGITIGLLAGQDVFTVPTMAAKLDAQLRGLGAGFLPEPMARPFIATGALVALQVKRQQRSGQLGYAWRENTLTLLSSGPVWPVSPPHAPCSRPGIVSPCSRKAMVRVGACQPATRLMAVLTMVRSTSRCVTPNF
jgi:DNA-binding transcriptional LysR family regulator